MAVWGFFAVVVYYREETSRLRFLAGYFVLVSYEEYKENDDLINEWMFEWRLCIVKRKKLSNLCINQVPTRYSLYLVYCLNYVKLLGGASTIEDTYLLLTEGIILLTILEEWLEKWRIKLNESFHPIQHSLFKNNH